MYGCARQGFESKVTGQTHQSSSSMVSKSNSVQQLSLLHGNVLPSHEGIFAPCIFQESNPHLNPLAFVCPPTMKTFRNNREQTTNRNLKRQIRCIITAKCSNIINPINFTKKKEIYLNPHIVKNLQGKNKH